MPPNDTLSYADRLFLGSLRSPLSRPIAQRAIQKAARLLSLAFGQSLREFRDSADPLVKAYAFGQEQGLLARILADAVDILGSRFEKLPEGRRPHYTPHQRWRILEIRRVLAFSADETAALFRVSAGTILRWEVEAGKEPGKDTVGSLLKPIPPARRYADVVRHLVQTMDRLGFKGTGTIAATLARAGWRLARETVRRYRHEPPVTPPQAEAARRLRAPQTLQARYPNHLWLVDITHVKGLFGLISFRIGAVLDAFSRMPLAVRVFRSEPKADDLARLVLSAVRRHRAPRHLVSDQGKQFTAATFERALELLGVRQRFGAIGYKGSIALLERWWRTLKDSLRLPLFRPLTQNTLEARLAYFVQHYSFFRPHQALGGRTPAEAFFAWPAAEKMATSPPRGRRGAPSPAPPFQIDFLDPERRHPVLVKAA